MNKYEIYLPLKYNNGAAIEREKIKQIRQQLMAVFGAITISSKSAPFEGAWRYGGVESSTTSFASRSLRTKKSNSLRPSNGG
jgi:hypothetical protein